MNNYLAGIAARTLNTAPLVRPRLHGRFDPAPAAINGPQLDRSGQALRHTESESEATTSQAGHNDSSRAFNIAHEPVPALPSPRETTTATTRPVGNDTITPQTLLINHAPSESHSLLEAEHIQQHTRIEAPASRQPFDAAESLNAGSSRARERAEPIRAQSPKDKLNPSAAKSRPVPHEVTPAIQALSGKRAELTPNSIAPAETVRERELQTIVIREDSSLRRDSGVKSPAVSDVAPRSNEIRDRESKASPVTVHSRIAPAAEFGPERLPLRQTRAQPPPTIHVTIGRIEVRAVQQSQSAAKPRASQPVMNLDDYLRRRSQGSA